MTDLDKLIEAVEAKDWPWLDIAAKVFPKESSDITSRNCYYWASDAYRGSLDAAKALHEALLPGWAATIDFVTNEVAMYRRCLDDDGQLTDEWNLEIEVSLDNLARAWLLATLRAYRSQVQK